MSTPIAPANPYQYFNFDFSDPDVIVILNRGTQFEKDITNDIRTASTSNSVESIAGSFNITLDNTNDAYVDRFGYTSVKVMSAIEIFGKSLSASSTASNIGSAFDTTQIPSTILNLNQFVNTYYNNPNSAERDSYQQQIIALNSNRQVPNAQGIATKDPITNNDFLLTADTAGLARMNNLRQSPIKVPQQKNLYLRIFFGVILNVSQNVNPGGELTINLSGKSIGYWLEATPVNIKPGGFEFAANNVDPTVYSNRYANTHAMDIFRDLIRFSADDLVAVTDFNKDTMGTSETVLELNGTISDNLLDIYGNPLKQQAADGSTTNADAVYTTTKPSQKMNELDSKMESLYGGIPLNNSVSTETNDAITGSTTWTNASKKYIADKKILQEATDKQNIAVASLQQQINATPMASDKKNLTAQLQQLIESGNNQLVNLQNIVNQDRATIQTIPEFQVQQNSIIQQQDKQKQDLTALTKAGRSNVLNQVGIISHWKKIFGSMILEVVDTNNFLNLVYPLKIGLSAPDPSMDGDYISKSDLANMIAQNLMYEFYVDTNGHFILKPPLYNIGIQSDDPNYVIEETDLISLSINESVEGIITRIGVTGDIQAPVTLEKLLIYNIHQDMNLIRDYGFHAQEIANRMFLHDNIACRDFGKSYMTKNNMELASANVTILGRPELRLGTTIYLKPRDTMYYIKEINHEITAGGQFQTTLTLVGARRIVTGFKAQSNLTTVTQQTNASSKPDNTGMSISTVPTIHYILSSAVNPEAITDSNIKTSPVPFNREQGLNATQVNAVNGNPNSTLLLGNSITPNDMVNQKAQQNGYVPQILRNVYQITSSISPAYIGLIVDLNSEAISNINVANFNFFANLTVDSISDSLKILNIPKNKQAGAVKYITDQFNTFINANISPLPPNPNKFTLALRDQFILNFLKSTTDQVSAATVPSANSSASVSKAATDVATACVLFNQIINQIDNNGSYRQFTDNDGRELPSYLDYGKSLLIENQSLTVAQFTDMSKASAKQQQDHEATRKATIAKNSSPQSSQASPVNAAILASLSAIKNQANVAPVVNVPITSANAYTQFKP